MTLAFLFLTVAFLFLSSPLCYMLRFVSLSNKRRYIYVYIYTYILYTHTCTCIYCFAVNAFIIKIVDLHELRRVLVSHILLKLCIGIEYCVRTNVPLCFYLNRGQLSLLLMRRTLRKNHPSDHNCV